MMTLEISKEPTHGYKQYLIKCELCAENGEDYEAQAFCFECKQCLCLGCKKVHSLITSTRSHIVVRMGYRPEASGAEGTLNIIDSHYCSSHQKTEVRLYCCDCDIFLCHVCLYEKHKKHVCRSLHDVINEKKKAQKLLQETVKEKREALNEDQSLVSICHERCCDEVNKLEQEREKTLAEVLEAAQSIEQEYDNLIACITLHKSHLINSLEMLKEFRLKQIEKLRHLHQLGGTEIDSFLTYSRMVLERGTDGEIIRVADELHKRAEELIKSQDERNEQQLPECCIKFIPSPAPTSEDIERFTGKFLNTGPGDLTLPSSETTCNETNSNSVQSNGSERALLEETCDLQVLTKDTGAAAEDVVLVEDCTTCDDATTTPTSIPLPEQSDVRTGSFLPEKNNHKYLKLNGSVKGITVLDDQMYFTVEGRPFVFVYNSDGDTAKPYIRVPNLNYSVGLVGCSHYKRLYIADEDHGCINIVNINNRTVDVWWVTYFFLQSLSMTKEHNVLITVRIIDYGGYTHCRVMEYMSKGQLIRDMAVDSSIKWAWQTIKLSKRRLVISHGSGVTPHRLCVISSEGQIIKSYGRNKGRGEGLLNEPRAIAIDNNRGHLFVADCCNNRVLIFSTDLVLLGEITIGDGKHFYPCSLYFDISSDRLFVSEWKNTGRVQIISQPDLYVKES